MKRIPLTQNKYAIVDDDLFDELSQSTWQAMLNAGTWVARRKPQKNQTGCILMHREIFRLRGRVPPIVRPTRGLDVRFQNLQAATHKSKQRRCSKRSDNTTGYIGVIRTPSGRWVARVGQ